MHFDLINSRKSHTVSGMINIISLECGKYLYEIHKLPDFGGHLIFRSARMDHEGNSVENMYVTPIKETDLLQNPPFSLEQQRSILKNLTDSGQQWPNLCDVSKIHEQAGDALGTLHAYFERVELNVIGGNQPSQKKKRGNGIL